LSERLAADSAYGSAPSLHWLLETQEIGPHILVFDKSRRDDGTFSRSDFQFDEARNVYNCPRWQDAVPARRHRPKSSKTRQAGYPGNIPAHRLSLKTESKTASIASTTSCQPSFSMIFARSGRSPRVPILTDRQ